MNISNIKTFITYSQSTQPANMQRGELWLDTSDGTVYVYTGSDLKIVTSIGGCSGGCNNCGYIGGGYNGNNLSSIEKLQFSTDTNFTCTSVLSSIRSDLSACNSTTYGYFGGGGDRNNVGSDVVSHIDSLNFSNDSVQLLTNYIHTNRQSAAANSSQIGYFYGGLINSSSIFSTISKLMFTNNTTSQLTNYLSQTNCALSACNSSVAGYIGGGSNYSNLLVL